MNIKKEQKKLRKSDVAKKPVQQFDKWLKEAYEYGVSHPTAMTLATTSQNGTPSARIVLLKHYSDQGFVFFTNYESRKGDELNFNPKAALVFFWAEPERQVRIEGEVIQTDSETSDEYYFTRPLGSQISACISPQSSVVPDRKFLKQRWEEKYKESQKSKIERPEFWGGYCLIPTRIEFWQGRSGRLHDRILYEKTKKGWNILRLAP